MRTRPKLFPSDMPPAERRVYGAVATFYVVLFLLLIWPIYPYFAPARPFMLGVPLSLVYVVGLVVLGFLVLLALFVWEGRREGGRGRREGGREGRRGRREGRREGRRR